MPLTSANGVLEFTKVDDYALVSRCGRYGVSKCNVGGVAQYAAVRRQPAPSKFLEARAPSAQAAMDICERDSGEAGGLEQAIRRIWSTIGEAMLDVHAAAAHATPAQRELAKAELCRIAEAVTAPFPCDSAASATAAQDPAPPPAPKPPTATPPVGSDAPGVADLFSGVA